VLVARQADGSLIIPAVEQDQRNSNGFVLRLHCSRHRTLSSTVESIEES
jgi:hypothetical protein